MAIGLAGYDSARAASELRALFRGQWANGMLPHVIFADDVRDAGSTRMWQSHRHPLAPPGISTSCITQPPVPAIAVARVADQLPPTERGAFLADVFPKLLAYHEWLYRERDIRDRGLITLIHPWECGLDTSPPWMQALARMPKPWWARVVIRLHAAHLLRLFRRDTRYVPAVQRPTDTDGLGMLVLVEFVRRHGFELRRLPRDDSVLIEDLAFNSILAAANRALAAIAAALGESIPPELAARFARTETAIEALWDDEAGEYFSRDASTGEPIRSSTVATFLPLYAGVASHAHASRLIARLREPSGFWPRFPVPSVPTDAPEFRVEMYWQGPTWINTNWMIAEGLDRYGEAAPARELRERSLTMVAESGYYEYFSAITGDGYGAPDFSWTAALVLDLLAKLSR